MNSTTITIAAAVLLAASLHASAQNAVNTSSTDNYALEFNGQTDYVAAPGLSGSLVNNFTIDLWVNPTAPHEIDRESSAGYAAGISGQHFAVYPLHGTACWGADHAGAGISVGTNGISVYEHAANYMPAVLVYEAPINGWTHIAVVYQDRRPSLFINGILVRRGVVGSQQFVHPSAGRLVGEYVYGGIGGGPLGYFAGTLDDVHFWGTALSATEITADAAGTISRTNARPLVALDMNRTGYGSGLSVVNNAARGMQSATTLGTSTTPIFVQRSTGARSEPGMKIE